MATRQANAIRRQGAQERLDTATTTLADRFGIEHAPSPFIRDQEIAQISELERMAGLLEGVIAATEPKAAAKKPAAKDA